MPTYSRRDDWVTDAQGRALAGTQVYYCTQPATTTVIPPIPLATIYSDSSGTPLSQPVLTDGFGHAVAYADPSVLYTIVYVNALFGATPIILNDQSFGGGGGGGGSTTTAFSGTPVGTIDGTNTVFTFSVASSPKQVTVWKNFPLINGLGVTTSWAGGTLTITYASAPQVGDALYVQGWY